jgi:hypothetical protein
LNDSAADEALSWLRAHPDRVGDGLGLEALFARAVRKGIDEVIDGARTGRYRYDQLESQEKSYIGTRIEIVIRAELELSYGKKLDTEIAGHEVDIKWSAKGRWMIPTEAVDELCLVLKGDERKATFSVGLVRCRSEWLNPGQNKDQKGTLSSLGRDNIAWLVRDAHLPASFLAGLPKKTRAAILAQPAGQARVRELFTRVPGHPVPREVIATLAVQVDPMRRIRQDSADRLGGMKVLSGHYKISREAADALGYGPLSKRDYVAVPIEKLATLPKDVRDKLVKTDSD